ncbi:MAG: phosphopantetheine-binding protein [Kiritimatiellae bacterium]|nr:phosphopantetheine-binding protein [Kiritimatiellia bacterium]
MKRSELEDEIRQVILSSVEVDGLTAADLPADVPLFGEGVGLDSIDALEIGAALRKKYQVKFKANSDENKIHFRSVGSLAAFIAANAGIALEENA